MAKSQSKKPNKILMKAEDCESICILLKSGFTFQNAILLIKNSRNQYCVDYIIEHLQKGKSIEEFFLTICPKRYSRTLGSFLAFLPFADSLQLAVSLEKSQAKFKKDTIKELIYPLALFIGTWCGVVVFTFFCFPVLLSLMRGFSMTSMSLMIVEIIMKIICILIFVIICITMCLICLFVYKKTMIKAYLILNKCLKKNLLKQYQSNLFAIFYVQCSHCGCKTKETLALLSKIKDYPILQFISESIQKGLNSGDAFDDALTQITIDETLTRFMRLAMLSSSMEELLVGYIETNQEQMKKRIKRITKVFQVMSYCSIGIIIIVVYQVLILPLTLMSKL